jgi:hypothetical protein
MGLYRYLLDRQQCGTVLHQSVAVTTASQPATSHSPTYHSTSIIGRRRERTREERERSKMYPAQRRRGRMVLVDVQPYEMCTIEECQLRIRTNEISIWERSHTPTTTTTNEEEEEEEDSNNDHHDRHGHRHRQSALLVYDPCKVITKYRRSVAGGSPLLGPPRSFTALQTTVQYLIHHIYIPQPQQQQTYLSQISFWEDRIRAVQVDLVRSNVTSKRIQQFIVKCYILLLYILSDCHQYEHTFGHTALQTSLSGYWEDGCRVVGSSSVQQRGTTTCISDAMDDEILSYNICIQLHQQLQILMSTEENIVVGRPHTTTTTTTTTTAVQLFWSQCTELYRQVTTTRTTGSNTGTTTTTTMTLLQRLPFLQWTFRLAFQCMGGYWQSALSMLLQQHLPQPQSHTRDTQQSSGPSSSLLLQSLYNNNNNNNKCDAMTYSPQDWERFQVLVKCTLAPALPYLRYKVLQTMNVTYMKNESISITEVARLLCYDHHSSLLECLEFCRRWGLPIHENDEQIRCKVVPIQPFQRRTTDRVRSNDAVILGNDTPYYTSSDDILVPSPEWMTMMLT